MCLFYIFVLLYKISNIVVLTFYNYLCTIIFHYFYWGIAKWQGNWFWSNHSEVRILLPHPFGEFKNLFALLVSQSRAVVARRAHNPKVGGSNPPSATNIFKFISQHRDFKILLLTSLRNKKISYNLNRGILSTNLFSS